MSENKYADAKILDWWRDHESQEYFTIIEFNNELRLIITKVEEENG